MYQGRPITYGAGGYVDREGVRNKRSALFELVVRDGDLDELLVEPSTIVDEAATLAGPELAAWVRDTVAERSAAFGTEVEEVDGGLRIPLGDD